MIRSCVNRPDAITDFHRGGYEYWRLNCLMRLNFPTKAELKELSRGGRTHPQVEGAKLRATERDAKQQRLRI
ncbi:hypothetical protein RI054_31g123950 [Pseudoscourfieldia marina]